jgi:hypothetical protein
LTYIVSHHGALESNPITTEDDLFIFLLHHARKHTLKAMYPKAVADFADEVIGALMADRDLDDLKYPAHGEQSLLSRALHGVSTKEMRPHHWELIEFATQVYEKHGVDMEVANRLLIEILDLGATHGRNYFEQVQERLEGSVGSQTYLVSTALFRDEFGQDVRILQRDVYGDIRRADKPIEPRMSRVRADHGPEEVPPPGMISD